MIVASFSFTEPALAIPDVSSDAAVTAAAEVVTDEESKSLGKAFGEFVIYSYIIFSGLAGVKGIVDGYNRKKQQTKE